ncbi:uncharacterized protein LOC132788183 [Drosophila nasuta]|uniref:uncharacterized protein LOC132788183 n=1 Tax=Drosophila nasuta TaxID=42062 RepID=UPI00295E878F|nr:uncharacterized protein LOC132788183 [Drosophila nasuta]
MLVLFAVAIGILSFTKAHRYKIEFEDDELFSDCPNQRESVLNIHGLLNLTEWTIDRPQDSLQFSGNFTTVWNIQKTDRIQGSLDVFKYERREWVPTIYKMRALNFCSILFDKNQYWYRVWGQHVTNLEEVKDKCFKPGTKYMHETFEMYLDFENRMQNVEGEHKIQFELKAFDEFNRMRPTSICFVFRVNFVKLPKEDRFELPLQIGLPLT